MDGSTAFDSAHIQRACTTFDFSLLIVSFSSLLKGKQNKKGNLLGDYGKIHQDNIK